MATYEEILKNLNIPHEEIFSKWRMYNNDTMSDWTIKMQTELVDSKSTFTQMIDDILYAQKEAFRAEGLILVSLLLSYDIEIVAVLKSLRVEKEDYYSIIRNTLANKPRSTTMSTKQFTLEYLPVYVRGGTV